MVNRCDTSVTAALLFTVIADPPKFIDCNSSLVKAAVFQNDVRFECDIQGEPTVSDVIIKYGRRSLRADGRDGNYRVSLLDQPQVWLYRVISKICMCI